MRIQLESIAVEMTEYVSISFIFTHRLMKRIGVIGNTRIAR